MPSLGGWTAVQGTEPLCSLTCKLQAVAKGGREGTHAPTDTQAVKPTFQPPRYGRATQPADLIRRGVYMHPESFKVTNKLANEQSFSYEVLRVRRCSHALKEVKAT